MGKSDFTGWVGDPKDLFRNVCTADGIYNESSDPIKEFRVCFKRTQQIVVFGLGTGVGTFKNIKAALLGSGSTFRGELDASDDPRPKTSLVYKQEEMEFNEMHVEFYTTDRIDLTNIFLKEGETNRLVGYNHKFGINPLINITEEEDIWDLGDLYTFTTAPQPYYISSASALDNQDIFVDLVLFDGTYLRGYQTTVTLDGQNKVLIDTPHPCWAINRAYNDNGTPLSGQIYIYEDTAITSGIPNDLSYARASIRVGHEQTEMAVYTLPHYDPNGLQILWGEIYRWRAGVEKNKDCSATAHLKISEEGKVARTRDSGSLTNYTSLDMEFGRDMPLTCRPGADVFVRVSDVSANDVSISAGFTIKPITL